MQSIETPTARVCRMRAQHHRDLAEMMSNQITRDNLLRIAADYDLRALQEDERAGRACDPAKKPMKPGPH